MTIAFLLPHEGNHPGGGLKIIYEYANGLTARGHKVHLVHFASAEPRSSRRRLRGRLRFLRYFGLLAQGKWRPDNWFALDKNAVCHLLPQPAAMYMPKADAYIATWWSTAEYLADMPSLRGRKLYLIQHLETWAAASGEVLATWTAPLEKIVIARWLQEIATGLGQTAHYIPNGLDFDKFGCDVSPEARDPLQVAMMYNEKVDWKGSAEGLSALLSLKQQWPDLKAELFGVHPRSDKIPSWIVYHHQPAQHVIREIYNRAAVFIAPSHSEGWGLPPCEAMMCGAAVVATDIGGHREFCIENETALLVPVKDPVAIADAVSHLLAEPADRIALAKQGNAYIQRFTWTAALDAFEQVLRHQPAVDKP